MTAGVFPSWRQVLDVLQRVALDTAAVAALSLSLVGRHSKAHSEIKAINRHFSLALPEPDEYLLGVGERRGHPAAFLAALAVSYASLTDRQLENIWRGLPHFASLEAVKRALLDMKGERAGWLLSFLQDFSADAQVKKCSSADGAFYFAFDPQTGKAVLLERHMAAV